MKPTAITGPRASQPDIRKRIGALAKGGLTQRGYTPYGDRPRNAILNELEL